VKGISRRIASSEWFSTTSTSSLRIRLGAAGRVFDALGRETGDEGEAGDGGVVVAAGAGPDGEAAPDR
jgi:hypothetical protein